MNKPALLPLMLGISVCLHVCLLLFLSVKSSKAGALSAREEGETFSLVNIAELVPAAAPAPPRASPPIPLPVEPILVTEHEPAELYIEAEEVAEDQAENEAGADPAPIPVVSAGAAEASLGNATAERTLSRLAGEYVKRNYRYIQRRIRDRLVYPAPARKAGIQGTANVSFTIHEDGRVSAVTVLKSSGHSILDEAAMETIYAASPFPKPPAPARIAIPIAFRLR